MIFDISLEDPNIKCFDIKNVDIPPYKMCLYSIFDIPPYKMSLYSFVTDVHMHISVEFVQRRSLLDMIRKFGIQGSFWVLLHAKDPLANKIEGI